LKKTHIIFHDTPCSQNAFEKHYPELSRNLQAFYKTKKSSHNSQSIKAFEEKLTHKFQDTFSKIKNDHHNNQQLEPDKTPVICDKHYRIRINLLLFKYVTQLFNQLDEVAALINSNYQSGNFSLKDKKRKEHQLQQFVLKLTHYSRDISNRAISL
jgi:stress-induced morphogen